jgi:DNA-binding MarR family transcriptional regulator
VGEAAGREVVEAAGAVADVNVADGVGLSDSALSKQLTSLEEAGYVDIRKGFVGKRPRTSAKLNSVGRAAFERHVAALQQIVARAGASVLPP